MECVGHDKLSCSCIPLPKTTIFNELAHIFGLNQFRSFKTKATPHKPTIQYLDYMNQLVQNHQVIWGLTSPFEPSIKRPSQSPPSIDSMGFLGTTIYGWVSWKIPILMDDFSGSHYFRKPPDLGKWYHFPKSQPYGFRAGQTVGSTHWNWHPGHPNINRHHRYTGNLHDQKQTCILMVRDVCFKNDSLRFVEFITLFLVFCVWSPRKALSGPQDSFGREAPLAPFGQGMWSFFGHPPAESQWMQ